MEVLQWILSFSKHVQVIDNVSFYFCIEFAESQDFQDERVKLSDWVLVLVSVLMNKRDYLTHYLRSFCQEEELVLTQQSMVGQKMMPLIAISRVSQVIKQ